MTDQDVEVIERTSPYRGYARVDVYRLRHQVFDQGWSDEITREVLERGHAAAVLPYDPVLDAVVLIEQFRIGAYAAPDAPVWQIECVAGIIDPGQTPEGTAIRELHEEAGLNIQGIEPVFTYLSSPGVTSETIHLFVARVDAEGAGGIHGLAHEHEFIRVLARPAEEAFEMVARGEIGNGMTLIALQWLRINRERLRAEWLGEAPE